MLTFSRLFLLKCLQRNGTDRAARAEQCLHLLCRVVMEEDGSQKKRKYGKICEISGISVRFSMSRITNGRRHGGSQIILLDFEFDFVGFPCASR